MQIPKQMKAIGFNQHLPIKNPNSLKDITKNVPGPTGHDILVKVNAVSVNPVDVFSRLGGKRRNGKTTRFPTKIIGYDAVGTVVKTGKDSKLFNVGDRVWYAGDITRPGTDEQYQLVDERIVGRAPQSLNDKEAASVPLVALTSYESLFEMLPLKINNYKQNQKKTILIINGSGGVGSMAVQLAHLAGLKVISTASNPKAIRWVKRNGADYVVNHHQDLVKQVRQLDFKYVGFIMNLNKLDLHWNEIATLIRPDGYVTATTENQNGIDLQKLTDKRVTFAWEWMYAKSKYHYDMISQHHILDKISELYNDHQLKPIMTKHYSPINAENLRKAHANVEAGHMIGKVTLSGWK